MASKGFDPGSVAIGGLVGAAGGIWLANRRGVDVFEHFGNQEEEEEEDEWGYTPRRQLQNGTGGYR